jgi:hypothetical protein
MAAAITVESPVTMTVHTFMSRSEAMRAAESARGKLVNVSACVCWRLRHLGKNLERALDDAKPAPIGTSGECFGRLGRRVEGNKADEPFGRSATRCVGSGANGRIDRVLVRLGARQCRKRQNPLAVEARHRQDVDDFERIARQG